MVTNVYFIAFVGLCLENNDWNSTKMTVFSTIFDIIIGIILILFTKVNNSNIGSDYFSIIIDNCSDIYPLHLSQNKIH
jgi:hypothetical protein